jgi:hypothetical protein
MRGGNVNQAEAIIPRPRDYYSDLRQMRAHYPAWDITVSLEETIRQIVGAWRSRQPA